MAKEPRAKYECEFFDEWRRRWRVRRARSVEEIDAVFDEYHSAPIIPAVRTYIPDKQDRLQRLRHQAAIRRCRRLGGVLRKIRGDEDHTTCYFVDPDTWAAALREVGVDKESVDW